MEEKIIPITREVSVSSELIWELIDMAYPDETEACFFVGMIAEKVYQENKEYQSYLTKEAFADFIDKQIFRRYWEELLEKGRENNV
jgi:hypothetical protein